MSDEQQSEPQDGQDGSTTPGGTSDTRDDAQAQDGAQSAAQDGQDGDNGQDDDRGGGREAKFRRRAREAEAERDTLRGTVERLQRREVERLAGEHLAEPGDVWTVGGAELAALLDDGGDVDPGAVRRAAEALVRSRPGLARPGGARGGLPMGQGRRHSPASGASWREVIATVRQGR
jgi:hypothetical protein